MTDQATSPARGVNLARSFKPKDAFGQPRVLLRDAKTDDNGNILDGQRFVLGYVFGEAKAVKTITRTTPSGDVETYFGLEGNFEAIPTDDKRDTTKAPVAFLATHIHDLIAEQLRAGAETVRFAFEVSIVTKQSSTAGFVWEYSMRTQPAAHDPLADLRAAALGLPAPSLPTLLTHPAEGGDDAVNTDIDAAEGGEVPVDNARKRTKKETA